MHVMSWLSCGSGSGGALFSEDDADRSTLARCRWGPSLVPQLSVVSGGRHSIAFVQEGPSASTFEELVVVSGDNSHGQLPSCSPLSVIVQPRRIVCPVRVLKIALGWEYTAVLALDGRVFCCGRGDDGQLGLGIGVTTSPELRPIVGMHAALDVACSRSHTLAISAAGTLFSWGSSRHGLQPLLEGSTGSARGNAFTPQPLDAVNSLLIPMHRLIGVACGWQHSAALVDDGSIVTWGSNRWGQCGRDPGMSTSGAIEPPALVTLRGLEAPTRVTSMSCGWSHMAAIADITDNCCLRGSERRTAQVLTWGRHDLGQLGRPAGNSSRSLKIPTTVVEHTKTGDAAAADAHFPPHWLPSPVTFVPFAAGVSGPYDIAQPCHCCADLPPIPRRVACGAEHTLCAVMCGCAFSWGWNEHGNLGVGDTVTRELPTRVSGSGCCKETLFKAIDVVAAGALSFVKVELVDE